MFTGLNAPFDVRRFLTADSLFRLLHGSRGLNAPFGARCFLTFPVTVVKNADPTKVLMHLLALGAF